MLGSIKVSGGLKKGVEAGGGAGGEGPRQSHDLIPPRGTATLSSITSGRLRTTTRRATLHPHFEVLGLGLANAVQLNCITFLL